MLQDTKEYLNYCIDNKIKYPDNSISIYEFFSKKYFDIDIEKSDKYFLELINNYLEKIYFEVINYLIKNGYNEFSKNS